MLGSTYILYGIAWNVDKDESFKLFLVKITLRLTRFGR